jgi:hypothetical protein
MRIRVSAETAVALPAIININAIPINFFIFPSVVLKWL